jgi:hypothetical protein
MRGGAVRYAQVGGITKIGGANPRRVGPNWFFGVFTGALTCMYTDCGERMAVAGDYAVDFDPHGGGRWVDHYKLTYARPALDVVTCPEKAPTSVRSAAHAAAEVVWADPDGAANRMRVAVEELLTSQRIPKTHVINGKRKRRTAHQRIELFEQKKPDVAAVQMAVKWLKSGEIPSSSRKP